MRKTLFALMTMLALLAFPVSGYCGTDLSDSQMQTLRTINSKLTVVHELVDRHVMTAEEGVAADHLYSEDAKQVVGHEISPQEIQTIVSNADKTEGLGTFWNFVVVVAGILFLLAVLGLIGYYLADFLAQIPAGFYELMAYAGSGLMIFSGHIWAPFHLGFVQVEPLWFAIPGALGLWGTLFLTYKLHFKSDYRGGTGYMGPGLINFPTVMFLVCTVAWGAVALMYSHAFPAAGIPHVLAFASVVALQAALGFSAITMPGCIALGWTDSKQIPQSVFASLLILVGYVALKLSHGMIGDLALFESGAIFMGAFVYFLGLLIMSSKWYVWAGRDDGNNHSRYVMLQIITIASGIAAWYFGSAYHIGALLGVGGTFFTIYLLEKYYEMPWKGVGWAWSFLGLAAFLYFVTGVASNHPEYFVWGIR